MHDFVRDAAQAAGLLHRILDGLARLGLIPREIIQLAPYSIGFVLSHAVIRWIRLGRGLPKLFAAARKIGAPTAPIASLDISKAVPFRP